MTDTEEKTREQFYDEQRRQTEAFRKSGRKRAMGIREYTPPLKSPVVILGIVIMSLGCFAEFFSVLFLYKLGGEVIPGWVGIVCGFLVVLLWFNSKGRLV